VPDVAFINGSFVPLAEAKISIDDRGFQFGDGVYEVIRTYRGASIRTRGHWARLERSAAAIGSDAALFPYRMDPLCP